MNRILGLVFLLMVLILSLGDRAPAVAQSQEPPTTRAEIMALHPQIAVEGKIGESPEVYPDLDDLTQEGSMMTLVEWPTVCTSNGTAETEQTVLLAVSCGDNETYTTQFLTACSADETDPPGTMAAMVTEPGGLPVETFACFPIPPD